METCEKVNWLKSVNFLKYLPLEIIEQLASDCKEIKIAPGNILFQDRDIGESMFFVLSGALEVIKKNKTLTTIGPGEFTDELDLMQSGPRSSTAKAVTESLLLEINREQFQSYLSSSSQALFAFMQTLTQHNREDLHELEQNIEKLQSQEELNKFLNSILEASSEEIYIVDSLFLHFVQINSPARRNLGFSMEELKKMTFLDVFKGLTTEEFKIIRDFLLKEIKTVEVFQGFHQRKNGSNYPVEIKLQLLKPTSVPLLVAHVQDLTKHQEMKNKIKNITFLDSLTGLPNRNLFVERLNATLAEANQNGENIGVLFLDMDNFKAINDALGRESGDLLLKEISKLLQRCLGKKDVVARIGGDEFLVMIRGITLEEDVALVAQNLIDSLKTPILIGDQEINASFSIGISSYPFQGRTAQDLLMQAETALYTAKEKGKNSYLHFSPSILSQAIKYMDVERGLIKALEREEFVLHYQPIVNLDSGKIMGVEALLRWLHPGKGMIPPGDFIPVAEKSKLIIPIGDWVLKTACRQFKFWEKMGIPPMYVAVNYSGIQIKDKDPLSKILKIIREMNMDPQHLELEITETVMMENSGEALSTLYKLSEIGIQLAIDDFGTGYSSLTYLAKLPVDTLKIDRSFVTHLPEKTSAAIAKTVVSLGKALGMKTLAEGVETQEQKEFLRSIGCDCMQGNLFSKPLPEQEITKMLSETSKNSLQLH